MVAVVLVGLAIFGLVAGQQPAIDASCFQANQTVSAQDCCKIPPSVSSAAMDQCRSVQPSPASPPTEGSSTGGPPQGGGGGGGPGGAGGPDCMMQCVLTAMGGFANNAISADAIKQSLASTIGSSDTTLTSLVSTTVDTCASQAQSGGSASSSDGSCSSAPGTFMNCLDTALFKNCPTSLWTDSSDCQALKQKLDNGCPYFTLRGRGPPPSQ